MRANDRARRADIFRAALGWKHAVVEPLAGDASFRHYLRLRDNGRRAVMMDAPPDRENVAPFIRVARHLVSLGLSAPAIIGENTRDGFLLLEDLGDDTFSRILANGGDEDALYALAVDVLAYLHRLPAERAIPPGLPPYDRQLLLGEALLLTDWYMPWALGRSLDEPIRDAYIDAWQRVFVHLQYMPVTLVLRDYHCDNLMWLRDRSGLAACGLLDFQDAVVGPGAYDLMSLLEDARRDVAPDLKARMLDRYVEKVGVTDRALLDQTFAILAAQRHAKVIGIFTRLWRRDGKPVYLRHIPRVSALLEQSLRHPALGPVAEWFANHLPSERRIGPEPSAVCQ